MAKDYTTIADRAAELVAEYGRSMTAVKFDKVAVDSNKPWEGAADARSTGVSTVITGISVSISDGLKLGITTQDSDLSKNSDEILIVALGSASAIDLSLYNEIIDQSINWKITVVEKLKPANMVLLYFVGVKR